MLECDSRQGVSAASAALPHRMPEGRPRSLSAAALDATLAPSAPAYSPIVLAGIVRLVELAITVVIGFAIYAAYVVPVEGFEWHYGAAILAIAGMAMVALQAADVYQVQAFRGHEKQYMRLASAWSIVFLLAISISFFAKAGDDFSRVWLGSFYVLGLVALIAFRRGLFLLVRRWTREGRLDRRTVVVGADARGESLVKSIVAQRDNDVHIVGLFDDRNDDRAQTSIAGWRKLGTVDDLVEFARRTRIDLVIFSLPISAESRILQMLKKL
jgi:FlaA1/EpsC-like NDP-sugar epimerase